MNYVQTSLTNYKIEYIVLSLSKITQQKKRERKYVYIHVYEIIDGVA